MSTITLMTTLKSLTVWITTNCGKFLKRWEYKIILSDSCEACMQVKKQQLEPYMEELTGSKLGKEYIKAVYHHPAYLTYMRSTSYGMLGWLTHKLESRLLGQTSTTRYADDTTLMAEREEELNSLLMKVQEKSEKNQLKTQHSKN